MNLMKATIPLAVAIALLQITTNGQPAPQNPPKPPQQTPAPTQKPTFVSQVDLVTLDVLVRDKRGQFVPDLKMEDFVVLEDGVEQKVTNHTLFYGGRELSVQILNAPTAAPE